MKKMFSCAAILVILISSCTISKAGLVYDESVPLEQTAWITVAAVGKVVAYNGIAVTWPQSRIIQIPAGDTLLELNVDGQMDYNTYFKANGVLFRYNLQPEKLYSFMIRRNENGQIGLSIWSWDFGERVVSFDGHFVEFVPFLNLSGNDGPTVLN